MTSTLFCAILTLISCCAGILIEAVPLEYGTISWRQLSKNTTSNSGVYEISYCGGYPTLSFGAPTPKLGDVLTLSQGVGAVNAVPAGQPLNIVLDSMCKVTQLYARESLICCGVASSSLSLSVEYRLALTQTGGASNQATSIIPANPTMIQSPRFIDVVSQGLMYVNNTIAAQQKIQLQIEPYPTATSFSRYPPITGVNVNSASGLVTFTISKNGDEFSPPQEPVPITYTVSANGASSQLSIFYFLTNDTALLNTPPTLANSTAQLSTIAKPYYLQEIMHSFLIGASDPDGDPVSLIFSGTPWPAGAIITPLFTPYILPNRTISNCTDIANVTGLICANNTVVLPQYTDVGYPHVNTTSMFRIDWTPTPQQAAQDKTWTLCFRALDQRGAVSLEESCLSLYVPRPCPPITTPNLHNNLTYNSPVPQSPNVVGSIATWTCDDKYGIYTTDGSTIIRESKSQFHVQCLLSGRWNDTTSLSCKDLCFPDQVTVGLHHGFLSRTTLSIVGDSVNYTCNPGYQPNTNQRDYQCKIGGKFDIIDGQEPQCRPVPCPSLHIDFGNYTLVNGTDNTTATFTCNPGYTLSSSSPAVCSPQGTWQSIPSCIPNACQPLTLPYARYGSFYFGNVANYTNGVAKMSCPPNWYIESGKDYVTCRTDGSWESWNITCIPRCRVSDRLPKGPSGYVINIPPEITFVNITTIVQYGCSQAGLEYIGPSEYTCTSTITDDFDALGTLVPVTKGVCTAICLRSNLPNANTTKYYIASLTDTGLNITLGSEFNMEKSPSGITVYSVCQAGSSTGVATYTCNNGVWSIPSPVCSVTCTLPAIDNIKPSSLLDSYPIPNNPTSRYLIANQTIELSCLPEYAFPTTGILRVTCQFDGTLSTSIPTCIRVIPIACPAITLPTNVLPTSIPATPRNITVNVSCATGYTLQGNITTVTCLNNFKWTPYETIQCISGNNNNTNTNSTGPGDVPFPSCCSNDNSLSGPILIIIYVCSIIGGLVGIAIIVQTYIQWRRNSYAANVQKMKQDRREAQQSPVNAQGSPSPAAAAGASDIEFGDLARGGNAIDRSQAPAPILPPDVDDDLKDYVQVSPGEAGEVGEADHGHIQIEVAAGDEKSSAPRG